jgi:hypothetical protein
MSAAIAESPKAEVLAILNLPLGAEATEVELKLPKKIPFDVWENLTTGLITAEGSSQWLIGDSLVHGRAIFGEEYAQVIDVKNLVRVDESAIRAYIWVSESVPAVLRKTRLRWSHHKEVAKLSYEEQKAWLERAEELGWTVRELRANIRLVADDTEDEAAEPDLQVLQDPLVRQFFEEHIETLKRRLDTIPPNAPFAHNMVHAQIGHAQWQLDRTVAEERARVMEAIDEGWQVGTEIFNWLQRRSYFMREPDLQLRLADMCDSKKLREVKQGGRKENQRGDLTSIYVEYNARTGDAYSAPRGNNIYAMGDPE